MKPGDVHIGDRVIMVRKFEDYGAEPGDIGTVCDYFGAGLPGIDFDRNIGEHDCCGRAKMGHGLYVDFGCLDFYFEGVDIAEEDLRVMLGGQLYD